MRSPFRNIPPPAAAVFALGIGNQLGQVLLLRELLMVFHGHELTIGIILAFWVGWEAVGGWMGALVAERVGRPHRILVCLVLAVIVVMPATILVTRLLRGFFDAVPGTHLSLYDTVRTCFLVMAPLCVLMGAQFVLLARMWRRHRKAGDMSGAVRTYILEAIGHMTGGLLFSLLLVHVLSPLQIAAVMGALMLGGIGLLIPAAPFRRAVLIVVLLPIALAVPYLEGADEWAFRLQWRRFLPDSELVKTRQSKYGAINVARRRDQYSFFQSNHLAFSTGGPEAGLNGFEEIEAAHLAHLAVSQHPGPERVLLVGGGMRGVLREMLRYGEILVDYVELDRELIDVAYPYLPRSTRNALGDERVNVLTRDGRMHVKTTTERYDLVVVDLPDPVTAVLNRFYTGEFFRELSARLNPGGAVVLSATSTPGLRHSSIVNRNATLYHTLGDVFDDVLAVGDNVCLFFASAAPGQLTADAAVLSERYIHRGVESPGFSARHFHTLLQDAPVRRKNWILRHHGRSPDSVREPPDTGPMLPGTLEEQKAAGAELPPVERRFFFNSDFRPIGYYHTLVFLDRLTGQEAGEIFRLLLAIRLWWLAPIAAAVVGTGVLLRLFPRIKGGRGGRGYAVGLSVFVIGFSSMVMEVTLLFAFQSVYGYVFEQIGLIVALFMGGLALGGMLCERYVRRKGDLRMMAGVQVGFLLFAGMLAVGMPAAASLRTPALTFMFFAASTFIAGMLNGAHYPLAGTCRQHLSGLCERSAGFIYAVELVGACMGAALTGVALAPILGLAGACMVAGTLNITAVVVLWIAGW